jgi:hypothetical protein
LPVGYTHKKVDRDFFSTIGLADNVRSIKNLSGFQAFLIKANNLDQPELFFKKSILDLTWLGFEGSLNQGMPTRS